MEFKKLLTRTLSGLVYVGIITLCIFLCNWTIILLGVLLASLATIEFAKICHETERSKVPALILDVAGNICLACAILGFPIIFWFIVMIIRFIMELYMHSETPLKDLSHSMLSQVYIGIPMGMMVAIGYDMMNPGILFAMFLMIWINDTGAFLVGSAFGRHRLFERISPKKSWEGFFGGLIFNIAAAFLFNYLNSFFEMPGGLPQWIGFAIIVTAFATWGDLVESLFKRTLNIKDSGNIIPGHGGILDRIDSLLLVSPAIFIYFLLTNYSDLFNLI